MKLKQIGEFGFINRIMRGCLIRESGIIKSIGDDSAVFSIPENEVILVTTDLLIEGVHFIRKATSGFNLGHKAMAVNLSDIAAMGGTAREAFVSIGIPPDCPVEFLDDLYNGMKALAAEYEVNLLGGDTTRSGRDLIINVSITGSAARDKIVYRDNAANGDLLFTTGNLGDSRAGLHLVLNDTESEYPEFDFLKKAHFLPKAYLHEGKFLASTGSTSAMIDISDGLSSDLAHIIEGSNTGARIYADKLPISPALRKFCALFNFDETNFAVSGGEDYTLLFTLRPERADEISEKYLSLFGEKLIGLGEITETGKIELIMPDGASRAIEPSGWDHFRRGRKR
ncbi:MAG: thiamine-phosphate kinase [Deltaproteobacteria bacterium]|nr:thiamine-phosphate kinase [Deltaproteobacteria bacterium]